jgi:hypothetical protein
MSTIPHQSEGWDAFNARKQKERKEETRIETPQDDNQPESRNLTIEEIRIFENARLAVDTIKKTFETWMVIARGVMAARERADRLGGKQAFERILEQQGIRAALGNTTASVKSTATNLLRILENLPEVESWRKELGTWEQVHWSSPTSVYKHCPLFQRQAELDGAKKEKARKPSPSERIKELEAANAHLQEENARHDGEPPPFDLRKDSAQDIADKITRMVNADKAENIAKAIIGEAPAPKPSGPKFTPKAAKGYMRRVNAWKSIREDLKVAEDLTLKELQEFLDLLEYDIAQARAAAAAAPTPEAAAPAAKAPKQLSPAKRKAAIEAVDPELAARIDACEISLDDAERKVAIKAVDPELAERIDSGGISLDDAEKVLAERAAQ